MSDYTTYLTPKSSFLTGAASAFNLGGNFYQYNYTGDGELDDYLALQSDWMTAGEDIRLAIDKAGIVSKAPKPLLIIRLNVSR